MKPLVAAFGLSLLVAVVSAATAGEPPGPARPWEKYKILVERNAFSMTRGRKPTRAPVREAPAPRPERYTVLTGIAQQGEAFVAFLEEVQGGTTKVAAGDEIAGGKVTAITLDGIVFAKEGEETKVAIGSRLSLGKAPPGTGGAPTGEGTAAAPAPGASPKDLATSILERLRRRREQELGKK